MRLIPASAACPQAVANLVAKLGGCAAFSATEGDGHRYLPASVRVAAVMPHAAQRRGDRTSIAAVVFAGEGDGVLTAIVSAQRKGGVGADAWVLGAVDANKRLAAVAGVAAFGAQRVRYIDLLQSPEVADVGIRRNRRLMVAGQRRASVKADFRAALAVGHGDDRLLHHSRAAVVDVTWRPRTKALSQLVVARHLLNGRVGAVDSYAAWATALSACSSATGSSFPRFSARRSIPAHAVELKKYRCGIEPLSSTCDNEHTAASLGHSEILGVCDPPRDCSFGAKHITSVRPFPPWRDERVIFAGKSSKEAAEGVIRGGEDSGDVFPEDDTGLLSASKSS